VRTTAIAHVEATSALARMKKGKRLTAGQLRKGLDDLERLWRGLYVHAVSDALLAQAAESAEAHGLRAYDAVHLAGALSFREGEDLEIACWDKELRDAASQHSFTLIPTQLD
jgi:predicted nucleic acid-binding protein